MLVKVSEKKRGGKPRNGRLGEFVTKRLRKRGVCGYIAEIPTLLYSYPTLILLLCTLILLLFTHSYA